MPVSNPEHIPAVLHFTHAVSPSRILDIGVGTGSYGLLLRQGLDIGYGRIKRDVWQVTIDGIEIFESYRSPVWAYVYSQVMMGDIRTLLPNLGKYDLILCNDVLEHFPRKEARSLIASLLKLGRVVVATTPNREYPQGAWGGNEAEAHHCLLGPEDFSGLIASVPTGVTTCYVCTLDPKLHYPLLLAADRCVQVRHPNALNPFVRLLRKWRQWKLNRS